MQVWSQFRCEYMKIKQTSSTSGIIHIFKWSVSWEKGFPKLFAENCGKLIFGESFDSSLYFAHQFVYTLVFTLFTFFICSLALLLSYICLSTFPSHHRFFLLQNSVTFSQRSYFNSWWAVINYVWNNWEPSHSSAKNFSEVWQGCRGSRVSPIETSPL